MKLILIILVIILSVVNLVILFSMTRIDRYSFEDFRAEETYQTVTGGDYQ